MRITALLDNISDDCRLAAEHGLSLYIETERHRILFDSGQSDAFARNAEALGIDIAAADTVILSHGHYDHSGGLRRFLELNDHAPIYINEHAFGHFEAHDGRRIGIAAELAEHPRVIRTGDSHTLDDGLELCTCNAEECRFASHSGGLLKLCDGRLVQDDFLHEQYLILREDGKTVVISGCSHKGILNIMHWLKPHVLIGGFHFMGLDAEKDAAELDSAADALMVFPTTYYTGHCTGRKQFDRLKARMGDRLHYLAGGMTVEL